MTQNSTGLRKRKTAASHGSSDHSATEGDDRSQSDGSRSNAGDAGRKPGSWYNLCKVLLVLLIAAIATPILYYTISIKSGLRAAVNTVHNTTNYPPPVFSRYRRSEYLQREDFFFQWWNYLVYDAETDDHFNIIYQITDYAPNSERKDVASVSMVHMQGKETLTTANMDIPLADLRAYDDFSLEYRVDGKVLFRQTILDGDTYHLTANFPPEKTNIGKPVKWDLTFSRIHGMYGGQDQEEGNKDLCFIVSTLFGYNSRVTGKIETGEKDYEIIDTPRYRGYAAGSWGCQLPNGDPPVDYPWTWFWLSIPGTEVPSGEEIGIVMGTARFQSNVPLLNDIYGGFSSVGVGKNIWTSRFATVNHGGTIEVPLMGSASDGVLKNFTVTHENWADFKDVFGEARIPLRQIFEVETEELRARIDFRSEVDQYFRAPVRLEKDLKLRVFSDFRAVGVETHVFLQDLGTGKIIFDGIVRTRNALEYAYEPEVDFSEMKKHGLLGED